MKDRDLIIAILTEFYPDESRFLGEAVIEDVVDSVSLVVRQEDKSGYKRVSLVRACAIPNCQRTVAC